MSIFDFFKPKKAKPRTMLDEVQELAAEAIPLAYRQLAEVNGCAPTSATSDQEIMAIYIKVMKAFHEASVQRGEHLSAEIKNYIVFKFLQVKEMMGPEMVEDHLKYEVEKYLREGLREDYRQGLKLF